VLIVIALAVLLGLAWIRHQVQPLRGTSA
jgi:hypothetical protein